MRKKRKLVDILDVERFERAKAKIVGLGEALGRREKITDAKALRAMVNVAATMWGADDEGGKLLLVDWSAAGKHIVSTGERLADEVISQHVAGMAEALDMEITFTRTGKRYSFEYRSDKGVGSVVYDKTNHVTKTSGPN